MYAETNTTLVGQQTADHGNMQNKQNAPSTQEAAASSISSASAKVIATTIASTAALSACGGGDPTDAQAEVSLKATAFAASNVSTTQASRFLGQASIGANRDQIRRVQALGFAGWIDEQFTLPRTTSRWDWLVSKGFNDPAFKNSQNGFDATAWRKLLSAPDTLRQRMTLALSEIVVAAIDGMVGRGWRAFSAATYLDILEANAFGNYRNVLQQISTSAPMAEFLTYRGNVKYNPKTGALPDENYAREVMQLFTIGLVQLNLDGTPKLVGGKQQETYTLEDIAGLARVFTGWDYDLVASDTSTPDFKRRPLTQVPNRHEFGAKTFLGSTIPAGTDGVNSLKMALNTIFAHPNVAPFISRQLIQRLVSSNPSPAYVARVATVFNNDGTGVKGNLKAVLKAILLDYEARAEPSTTSFNSTTSGKLREPVLRFLSWARAFNARSATDAWAIGNTSDPGKRLGQSPLRSPSVFNFFRPGYVPPNSAIAGAGLVAPEFQITNESSVIGYVNYMQTAVSRGIGDVLPDYSSLLPLADDARALFDELNLVLAARQISATNLALMINAVNAMPFGTDAKRNNRIYAALVLILAAPEFIVQK